MRAISIIALVFWLADMQGGYAQSVTVSWDANTESDLAGYKIYHGNISGSYHETVRIGNVTDYTQNISTGKHYFAVTAYDFSGNESDYSEEVSITILTPQPSNEVSWPDNKNIKLYFHYKKNDTIGNPITPNIEMEWSMFSSHNVGNWSELVQQSDYSFKGDTLEIYIPRLVECCNQSLLMKLSFRARLENENYRTNWHEVNKVFQLFGISGIPMEPDSLIFIRW